MPEPFQPTYIPITEFTGSNPSNSYSSAL